MAHRRPRHGVTLHRFFLPPAAFSTEHVKFTSEASHQIHRVLRLQPGDVVIALDGTENEYDVVLDEVGRDTAGTIVARRLNLAEPRIGVTLYQGLLKGSKFEMVLQKCTEIGVRAFVPVSTARAVPREPSASRADRFETIVREAAEQSRRGVVPVIRTAMSWDAAIRSAFAAGPALVLWEDAAADALLTHVTLEPSLDTISLFVGPEGGLSQEEIEVARDVGALIVGLGPRILRAETAAIAGSALLMSLFEGR